MSGTVSCEKNNPSSQSILLHENRLLPVITVSNGETQLLKKVLQVIPYLSVKAGGPPVVVSRLCSYARKFDWNAKIVSLKGEGASLSIDSAGSETLLFGSQLAPLFGKSSHLLDEAISDASLVHLHTLWSPLNLRVGARCRKIKKPYVVSPHGMLDPWSLNQKRIKKTLYWSMIEHQLINESSALIFTTESEKILASVKIRESTRREVIALGADRPISSEPVLKSVLMNEYPFLVDRPFFVFLGRLHPKKRPETAISGFRKVLDREPQAHLVFAGAGEDSYVHHLQSIINSFDLNKKIHLLGLLTGDRKWSVLSAASAFLLPSQQENFALAAAEALHCGVPVVLSDRVNICKEVDAAGAGIVLTGPEWDVQLADACIKLLAEPNTKAWMSVRAKGLARSLFDWQKCAQSTYNLYSSILDSAEHCDY